MDNENSLARFCLFEAVPVDGCGNFDLRDPEHADGDCLPGGHEMDHQRRRARASTGQIDAANRAGGDCICFPARVQRAAHRTEQHV